ncbi:hypothetical protein [Streptomyces sp. NPDC059631]|uniref:hypothetical protein n=1 Tax=unclassified Streptomyces TaxID=2593676 RepID=UPI0036B24CD4
MAPEQGRAAVVDDKGHGANRWRDPADDLPADFEGNRDVHYAAQGRPQDSGEFIAALQGRLRTSLDRFEQAPAEGTTGGVAIVKKRGEQEEPESLVAIKGETERRRGAIDLLDILEYCSGPRRCTSTRC